MQNRIRREKGFLLLEALIAVAILAFAVAGLAVIQNKTLNLAYENRGHVSSIVIFKDVQDRLELNTEKAENYVVRRLGSTPRSSGSTIVERDLYEISENLRSFNRELDIEVSRAAVDGVNYYHVALTLHNMDLESGAQVEPQKMSFQLARGQK